MTEEADHNLDTLIELTAEVVSAYVSNNPIPVGDLPALIGQVHSALTGTAGAVSAEQPEALKPAVPIKKSVMADYIVCLEDGKKFKSLKRHLSTHYGLTPDEYRAKWRLAADYPMVAPNYAAQRRKLAHEIGLGRKASSAAPAASEAAAPKATAKPKAVKAAKPKVAAKPKAPAKSEVAAAPKPTRGRPAGVKKPAVEKAVG